MQNFNLNEVRNRLEALEETIVFRILDRAQFKYNSIVYTKDAFSLPNSHENLSFLDYTHKSTEQIYAKLGRFNVVEEKPFFTVKSTNSDQFPVNSNEINLTAQIHKYYSNFLRISLENDDDGEYVNTVEADIALLLAVSKRIHYGAFYVAECKFQEKPEEFTEAVKAGNKDKVLDMLVNRQAEENVLIRVFDKCQIIQSAYTSKLRKTIEPKVVVDFYKNIIIPLTVEGELQYFFQRVK